VDDQDLEALEGILHRRGGFSHREHLELTWTYLDRHPFDAACRAVAAAIQRVARLHGQPDRYHETLTRGWVRLVAVHRAQDAGRSFDEFIARHPRLLDRTLLSKHYSSGLLGSQEARAAWTEPDLRPLPRVAS
jgi:hypothetical protein